MAVLDLLLGRALASDETRGERMGARGLANVYASCDNRNANKEGVEQCRSPLTGRECIRRGLAAVSFSLVSPSLRLSFSVVGPRCHITWTCSGSVRSATGTYCGKR